jgi:hypothetical protein
MQIDYFFSLTSSAGSAEHASDDATVIGVANGERACVLHIIPVDRGCKPTQAHSSVIVIALVPNRGTTHLSLCRLWNEESCR